MVITIDLLKTILTVT